MWTKGKLRRLIPWRINLIRIKKKTSYARNKRPKSWRRRLRLWRTWTLIKVFNSTRRTSNLKDSRLRTTPLKTKSIVHRVTGNKNELKLLQNCEQWPNQNEVERHIENSEVEHAWVASMQLSCVQVWLHQQLSTSVDSNPASLREIQSHHTSCYSWTSTHCSSWSIWNKGLHWPCSQLETSPVPE